MPEREFGRVAVLMGGQSAEREISLKTGHAVTAALLRRGVAAEAVDVGPDTVSRLRDAGYDRAFVALHGRGGEDGAMQGFLETLGIPYTGSGVLGSAVAMDKPVSKRLWHAAGLPTPPFAILEPGFDTDRVVKEVGLPMMVKPAREGSSLGAVKVTHKDELADARAQAAALDAAVLAEAWITGPEYTAAILGDEVLPLIRLATPRGFYDYQAKYEAEDTHFECPCDLPPETAREYEDLGRRAFRVLGASGWGRVDFMVDEAGQPWLLEVNTIPGLTDHSLVPMAAREAGIGFDELVLRILATSEETRP